MSRLDTVRDRTGKVKKRVAPRAADARESAAEYADKLAPKVGAARDAVAPRLEQARDAVAPRLEHAKETVAPHLETAKETIGPPLGTARDKVRDDLFPKVAAATAAALAASEPAREEARSRGVTALAALKGEVTPKDVAKARKRGRGRKVRRFFLFAALAGAAVGAWRWWKQQSEPDWNVDEFRAPASPAQAETTSSDAGAASPGEAIADVADQERLDGSTPTDSSHVAR